MSNPFVGVMLERASHDIIKVLRLLTTIRLGMKVKKWLGELILIVSL